MISTVEENIRCNTQQNPSILPFCASVLLVNKKYMKNNDSIQYLVDSGASHHVCTEKFWFTSFTKNSDIREVRVGSNHTLRVRGAGDVSLNIRTGKELHTLVLCNVLYVPKMRKNLISVSKIVQQGYELKFHENLMTIRNGNHEVHVPIQNDLYRLCVEKSTDEESGRILMLEQAQEDETNMSSDGENDFEMVSPEGTVVTQEEATGSAQNNIETENTSTEESNEPAESQEEASLDVSNTSALASKGRLSENRGPVSLKEAHVIFGHVNKEMVKKLLDLEGFDYIDDFVQCESCIMAKQHRISYHSRPAEGRPQELGYVTGDLCTTTVRSAGGCKYFLLLTEEYSRYRKVYLLKDKTATTESI